MGNYINFFNNIPIFHFYKLIYSFLFESRNIDNNNGPRIIKTVPGPKTMPFWAATTVTDFHPRQNFPGFLLNEPIEFPKIGSINLKLMISNMLHK